MRLVYVCLDPGIPTFGAKGASVHVQELLRAYRQLGHHVRLVTVRTGGTPPADLADVEVVELPRPRTRDVAAREQALLALDAEAERVIDGLADVEVVHERYSLWGGAGVRAARRRGLPGLLEVNAPLIDEQRVHRDLHHVEEAEARLVATVGAATAVAAVSEPVAAWVRERVADAATTVVPNGVNTDRFHPPAAQPTRPFTVGFVGTLKPWHGVAALVEALALLRHERPDARLLLVGDGPRRDHLELLAAERGVPCTSTGAVPPADVPAYLRAMDVAAAPYPAGDAAAYFSPLKVLEYLAAGIPVVASDTGQVPSLLDHGRAGVLVAPGDAAALADGLLALANDPERRRRLAAAGRAKVLAGHRWTHVAATSLDLAIRGLDDSREAAA
jgi:glycosyltransferase involved in cell wall biosynthesis